MKYFIAIIILFFPISLIAEESPCIKDYGMEYSYELEEVPYSSQPSRHHYTSRTIGTLHISFEAYNCTSVIIKKSQPFIQSGELIKWSLITPINCSGTSTFIEQEFNGVQCGTWIEIRGINDVTGETFVVPAISVDSLIKDDDLLLLYIEQGKGTSALNAPIGEKTLIHRQGASLMIKHDNVKYISINSLKGCTLYQISDPDSDVIFNLSNDQPLLIIEIWMQDGNIITKKIII